MAAADAQPFVPLRRGTRVVLDGLDDADSMRTNGEMGVIVRYNASNGQYVVALPDANGTAWRFRPKFVKRDLAERTPNEIISAVFAYALHATIEP